MGTAQSKWFPDLLSDTPTAESARTVLVARCATVREFVNAETEERREDEPFHQLRVSPRRLVAAISIFEPSLDSGCAKRLRKAAARIRREAGEVRDADVLRGLLHDRLERA